MLIVFGAGLLAVIVEAFAPRVQRFLLQVVLSALAVAAALVAVVLLALNDKEAVTLAGAVVVDKPALFLQGTILVLALLAVLTMAEQTGGEGGMFTAQASATPGSREEDQARRAGLVQSEVYPLLMFSVGGMLLFPAADDLLTMFVALEVLSLPLYLLCGLARRRRLLSQEASLKYFLLGAFSSAFFLFGAAMFYGFAESVRLPEIAEAVAITDTANSAVGRDGLMLLGIALLC